MKHLINFYDALRVFSCRAIKTVLKKLCNRYGGKFCIYFTKNECKDEIW